jgi:CRP/FNR family transcriptional regulator, cyclic AMP receptor protein
MSPIAEQLAGSPLFKGVEQAEREALIGAMRRQHFSKGTVLFNRDDPGDSMYIILSGRVRITTRDAQGNEFTIRYLDQMFGEFAMLDQAPRSAAAVAADDLDVLVLHRDDFVAFLRERPLVGLAMMRSLVERVRYTTTYLQKVLDATHQLSEGNYGQALDGLSDDPADSEIQGLIRAFLHMQRSLQVREQSLQRQFETRTPPPEGDRQG